LDLISIHQDFSEEKLRYSRMLIPTLREAPGEAEVISHSLMLRAGLIRKVAAGVYDFLPLGWRVMKRVEQIIREEMDRAGAQEVFLPVLCPAELWQESGRWDVYGKELMRIQDRHDRQFCLGPTHEEVITDLVRREIHSYRQLPINLYQIQTKFRDEIRPRFGLMRGREFMMKDNRISLITPQTLPEHWTGKNHACHQLAMQAKGDYSEAYFTHGLAVQTAEATAEYLHRHVSRELGLTKGQGKRYSWGYPAIPELEDHRKVFDLLPAVESELKMSLSPAFQLIPEQSTAAIVIHHKDAKYYSVGESRVEQLMK